ncbi:hypothetical protein H310_08114 [Aphanomyces invadans]|uniref:F-box domain-containing protein n=1 Tax=Aphanomyces invadans TaxID=157072 RepID=A0A024TZP4_9STRA|nr:hypothetical protein H310_08114 [Aphanomyces invadans]ETV99419.1 hypothetical protein H310_08114 [Aphanomyces invadans]|eukprot:XP_008871975.1 hypothetical protein H310_08114 [Aphanomyces invadans]
MTRPEFDQVARVGELVLPPELMRRVALFIPDVATFFSFLETYDSAGILGDLGMIRILGESCLYEKLWPDLHVGTRPESPRASQMLVVAKHYSHFALSGVVDVAWMQELCRVAPATDLHATDIRPAWKEAMEPFVDALAKLPPTRATFSIPRSEIWVPFLPRLCDSLRSLRFTFHDHTGLQPSQLGTLLEFVCGSSQITDLILENDPFSPPHVVTTAMVGHLTKWFHLAPVTHFRVGQWQLAEVDPSALTSLYDAWATCSTLEALVVVETKLLHL